MSKSKEIAFLSVFLAFAILTGYIERTIPSPVAAVPGIKLGLANAIVLILLYIKNSRTAFMMNVMRIIASGILFSGVWGMLYSFSGALLSFSVMLIFKKIRLFGVVGVSVIGSVCHNIGQICVAVLVIENTKLFYYVPVLIFSGIIAGIIVGYLSGYCILRLKNILGL